MLYFSSLLAEKHPDDARSLFAALDEADERFVLVDGTRDVWLRDFFPVITKSVKYVSFRYQPSYLDGYDDLRTDFRAEIAPDLPIRPVYSDVNLDGGNVVLSPSKQKAIVSDRIFRENPDRPREALIAELSDLLEAEIVLIESLPSDMTGHADGMARFLDEDVVLLNETHAKNGLEQRQARSLQNQGFHVLPFPYHSGKGAVGCYLNYLETEEHLFLPQFGIAEDAEALRRARLLFPKKVVPVFLRQIPADGGVLNCISWED